MKFESDSAVPSANDFSLWISSQIESDAETEFLFSAREKLDMSRRRQAAKLDIIAITCNIFSTLGWFSCCVVVILMVDAFERRATIF